MVIDIFFTWTKSYITIDIYDIYRYMYSYILVTMLLTEKRLRRQVEKFLILTTFLGLKRNKK